MSNSINGLSHANNNISQNTNAKEAPKQTSESVKSQSESSSAVLNLTKTAETLQKTLSNTPEIDRQKVDSIKMALSEGKYQVDAERVAEKFIEIEKALGKV